MNNNIIEHNYIKEKRSSLTVKLFYDKETKFRTNISEAQSTLERLRLYCEIFKINVTEDVSLQLSQIENNIDLLLIQLNDLKKVTKHYNSFYSFSNRNNNFQMKSINSLNSLIVSESDAIVSKMKFIENLNDTLKNDFPYLDLLFIRKFLNLIDNNFSSPTFGIHDLCLELGLSKMQLHRRTKHFFGLPPGNIILQWRLHKSTILLQERTLSISEIAYELGFSSPSYFIFCFKKHFHFTPKVYRNTRRYNNDFRV